MWDNTFGHRPGFQLWDDSTAVRNLFLATEGGRTKVPTNLSYSEWDCTALFQATIYARSFALHHGTFSDVYVKPRGVSHGHFHASVVSPGGNNEETRALAVDQLRLLRNLLCHSSSSTMDKMTFDRSVQYAKDAFKALGYSTDSIDAVGSLTQSQFPTDEVLKLEQRIKEESRAYIKFLEGVSSTIDAIQHQMADKEDIAMLVKKMDDLNTVQDKPSKLRKWFGKRSRKGIVFGIQNVKDL